MKASWISNHEIACNVSVRVFCGWGERATVAVRGFLLHAKEWDGGDLGRHILGEDPNQTSTLENGMFKLVGEGRTTSLLHRLRDLLAYFTVSIYMANRIRAVTTSNQARGIPA